MELDSRLKLYENGLKLINEIKQCERELQKAEQCQADTNILYDKSIKIFVLHRSVQDEITRQNDIDKRLLTLFPNNEDPPFESYLSRARNGDQLLTPKTDKLKEMEIRFNKYEVNRGQAEERKNKALYKRQELRETLSDISVKLLDCENDCTDLLTELKNTKDEALNLLSVSLASGDALEHLKELKANGFKDQELFNKLSEKEKYGVKLISDQERFSNDLKMASEEITRRDAEAEKYKKGREELALDIRECQRKEQQRYKDCIADLRDSNMKLDTLWRQLFTMKNPDTNKLFEIKEEVKKFIEKSKNENEKHEAEKSVLTARNNLTRAKGRFERHNKEMSEAIRNDNKWLRQYM